MNLGVREQDFLDIPTKSFEVAYRSYIVNQILVHYSEETTLKSEIQTRISTIAKSQLILSGKIAGEINKVITKPKEWTSFWGNLQFVNNCFTKQEHVETHDVMFLSQLVYLSYMFIDIFGDLVKKFPAPERYVTESNQYYEIRNALSHRGSSKISFSNAKDAISFMKTVGDSLPTEYFWYKDWNVIQLDISKFLTCVENSPVQKYGLQHENLNMIPFSEEKIVCRERELEKLFKSICGWDGNKVLKTWKHLTCICGYGGVGKTVLVTEFISRLLDNICDSNYPGLRPEFILFYSAKTQRLDYNVYSGQLQINTVDSQITTFDEWKDSLLSDLEIDEFSVDWYQKGIIIIDNLETIDSAERDKIIQYINDEVPQEIRVIITTRIPEQAEADLVIPLRGFQNEDGIKFISEYITENDLTITLNSDQLQNLITYSSGNTLVLVLALKRLNCKKASFATLIAEMRKLPKNDEENSLSSFMYQCTIDEILRIYADDEKSINDVLAYFMLCDSALNPEVIASASASKELDVEKVQELLGILSNYLVVERVDDAYILNEFARKYIVVKIRMDTKTQGQKRQEIMTAVHQAESDRRFLTEYCDRFPELKDIIDQWSEDDGKDNVTIAKAFGIYENMRSITPKNHAYMLDQIKLEFEDLEKKNSTHPYVYYQRARILNNLRIKKIIGNEYNDSIKQYFDSCFMLLNQPNFEKIKQTKSFPSIESLYARFLLDIGEIKSAASYAEDSIYYFERQDITEGNLEYYTSTWVWGMSMIKLYPKNMMIKEYLQNSRKAQKTLNSAKPLKIKFLLKKQIAELAAEVEKYNIITV